MRKTKDPKDLWTAKPSSLDSATRAAYIYILQSKMRSDADNSKIIKRIGELM